MYDCWSTTVCAVVKVASFYLFSKQTFFTYAQTSTNATNVVFTKQVNKRIDARIKRKRTIHLSDYIVSNIVDLLS